MPNTDDQNTTQSDKNVIRVEPATLLGLVVLFLLVPLLLAGFFAH